MNRITKFAVPASSDRGARNARMTEDERFVSKVKFAGALLLLVVDLIVIVWRGIPM